MPGELGVQHFSLYCAVLAFFFGDGEKSSPPHPSSSAAATAAAKDAAAATLPTNTAATANATGVHIYPDGRIYPYLLPSQRSTATSIAVDRYATTYGGAAQRYQL